MATALVVGLAAVYSVVKTLRYLLSTDLEEGGVGGCSNRCKPRHVPVQAFKIIVVMWQILTQVGALVLDSSGAWRGKFDAELKDTSF